MQILSNIKQVMLKYLINYEKIKSDLLSYANIDIQLNEDQKKILNKLL